MTVTSRRLTTLLCGLLVVIGGTALQTAGPAAAATGSTLVSNASGRCLDVVGQQRTPGTRVNIYDCKGTANQLFTRTPSGEIRSYNGSLCLDVAHQDTTAPATVQIWTCNGGANQRWKFNANGTVVGVQSGLCLDVTGNRTANSTPVGLWTCTGQVNQRWTTTLGGTDTTAPTAPGGPRVDGLTCNAATLAWTASTDNVAVTAYDIYHDGQFMQSVGGATVSTTLTVVGGASWGLYVNARDAAGNVSQASATVPISPPPCQSDSQAPSAPTAVTAVANGNAVTVRWTAATDNVGVRAYLVYRDSKVVGTVTGTGAPPTTFLDSAVPVNSSHQYAVVARDGQGNLSAQSSLATVTTGAGCTTVCSVTRVVDDTDIPWGLVTLPDGSVVYSRRDAHDLIRLDPATGTRTSLGTVPNVASTDGEGGLTGLAIAPTFDTDHWLYVMHTSPTDNRIIRIRLENGALTAGSHQVLLSGIARNKFHDGGRLRFGPDGKLYAATGDAQNPDTAQNRSSLNGKVLRLNPDGGVPSDNPFGNYVWSYGHRNPQGLAFDSQGRLWEQEFGNSVMDETNLITKGGNYGWPACEGTSGTCGTAGFIAPLQTYPVAEGSCSGIAIVGDVLYVACLRGARVYREVISDSTLVDQQVLFQGTFGRLRTVEPAPGGGLWLTTSNYGDKDSIPNNGYEVIMRVALAGQ